MNIIVTGGAGFIGSNFVLHWIAQKVKEIGQERSEVLLPHCAFLFGHNPLSRDLVFRTIEKLSNIGLIFIEVNYHKWRFL